MPSTHKPQTPDPGSSLGDMATRYLSTISKAQASETHQELFKFIRWYGEDRPVISLTGQEIANYSDQFVTATTKSVQHLNIIKLFLVYNYKCGLTSSNMGAHIRVKKVSTRSSAAVSPKVDEPFIMTSQGHEDLKRKLAVLKEERPKITDEIRKAAADKDFRENAPLEAAREKQGHIEGQIRDIENTLKHAKIVESSEEQGLRISIGDTATIVDTVSEEKISYTLVGSKEANIKQGRISIVSPMGQALFNKEVGEVLEVNAPSGVLHYRILDITKS
jgi:transcription elongation factor GreA